ncbi:MAG TPA: flagellar basal-body MS-ring/collar protein FliF [Burkholderiales bacterium]|nr:flagellar basal-body MS-ring/collar protein FliF [Burkholderiales bacterium]
MSGEAAAEGIAQRLPAWTRIPPQQLLAILMVVATALALVIGGWMWSTAPDYKVLFSNLSDKDGGAVVAALQQANVPYKFADGGGAILVPAEHVHDLRLKLAGQGLPKGGLVGLELMEGQRFGASQFLEQVNYQRGLEGELARSIQTIQAVATARIHLALPRGTAFLREQAKPSASVLVHLHPGRTLDQTQVAAIVHLVSNSVPDLAPKNVTVVDQNGTLLSADGNSQGPAVDTKQLKYRQETELGYIKRIEAILAPVLGAANVRAQVSADLDFSEVEQAEELYKPNGKPEEAAVRTSQTSEQSGPASNGGASGVPGALTNQPPQSGGAPVQADPNATAASTPGASGSTRKESAVTYEVDKSIRHTRIAQGRIKRLSVAVVVNDRQLTDAKGKVTSKPLTDAEKQQITELVKGVMGYDKERGDTLSVINSAFSTPAAEKVVDVPMWKDPSIIGMAKEIGKYLLYGALVLFILMKLKPFVSNILKPAPLVAAPAQLAGPAVEGELIDEPAKVVDRYETTLGNAKQIAKQDPKVVANVVKNWVGSNER